MAASTVPLRPTASSAPVRPESPLPSGREGSPARAPAPSQSLGGSKPQPESCHLTGRSLGLQVPARTRPPGDRRGGVPASTRRRAPGPSPCSGSVGSPLCHRAQPCSPGGPCGTAGRPQESGLCVSVLLRVLCGPPPPRKTERKMEVRPLAPRPQCWVVLGAAAQRGHWAEAQGCGSGPWICGAPRAGTPSWADTLNATVPAGRQELPQGLRTHRWGG